MSDSQGEAAIRRRPLGRTGLTVGEIGFGAGILGTGNLGPEGEQAALAALARAFELGVNFVDTADWDGTGQAELLIGKALKVAPRRVHLATHAGQVRRDGPASKIDFSSEILRQECDRSLSRLGVTCIDLFQLHYPPLAVIAGTEVWDSLRELKDLGKIAHYGISVENPEEGMLAMEKGEVESVQVVYNLLDHRAAKDLFPQAERKGVAILVREPLASGMLTGKVLPGHSFAQNDPRRKKFPAEKIGGTLKRVEALRFLSQNCGRTAVQAALCFSLAHEAVSVVLPGIRTAQQAEENAAVGKEGVPALSAEELARICAN